MSQSDKKNIFAQIEFHPFPQAIEKTTNIMVKVDECNEGNKLYRQTLVNIVYFDVRCEQGMRFPAFQTRAWPVSSFATLSMLSLSSDDGGSSQTSGSSES